MKHFKITVRKNIFSPSGLPLSDEGLKAVDGYWEFLVVALSETETYHSLLERTIPDFEQRHPNLHDVKYEVVEV